MKIIGFLLLILCSLTIARLCPDYCHESDFKCRPECIEAKCDLLWKSCESLQNCSQKCIEKLGNGKCDPVCDIEECFWDSFECKDTRTVHCQLESLGNGLCDPECNTKEFHWDHGDCVPRKLTDCNCTNVSENMPLLIYVSDSLSNSNYADLDSALNYGACCLYNEIILEKNTEVGKPQATQTIFTSNIAQSIVIKGATLTSTIAIIGNSLLGNGDSLKFEGLTILYQNSMAQNFIGFDITGNSSLIFENINFVNQVNQLAIIEHGHLLISNSQIEGNTGNQDFISTGECENYCGIEILNSTVNKFMSDGSQFLVASFSEVSIKGLTFNNTLSHSSVFVISNSVVTLCNITTQYSNFNSFLYLAGSSQASLISSTFSGLNFQNYLIKLQNCENFTMHSTVFDNINMPPDSNIIVSVATSYILQNMNFSNYIGTAIDSTNNSYLKLFNCNFIGDLNQGPKSGIYSYYSAFEVHDSNFQGLGSSFFGGIKIVGSLSGLPENLIQNSVFKNCFSLYGAGIYVYNANVVLKNNLFFNNTSVLQGGALYSVSSFSNAYNSTLISNTFELNSAKTGGAIFWDSVFFTSLSDTFLHNNATTGDNLATPGQTLTSNKSTYKMRPGQFIPECFEFTLRDYYNQTVGDEMNSMLGLSILDSFDNSSLFGTDFLPAQNGYFSFCNLEVRGLPGSNLTIRAKIYGQISSNLVVPYLDMSVTLDVCNEGEVLTESMNQCVPCAEGTYTMSNNETKCNPCPDNAVCYNNTVTPLMGYWHSSNSSIAIFECINPDSCLANGQCAQGYTGNLCGQCSDGFTLGSSNVCTECPSFSENIVLIVLLSAVIVALISYIIYRTYEDAYEPKLYHSVLIKILMNYIQLMMLTTVLKMRWPEPFYQLINMQEQISSSTGKLMSLECLIKDHSSLTPFYFTILSNFLLPLFLGVIISVVWGVVALIKKSIKLVVKPYITSLVVVFFILHPGISNTALSIFTCHEIENGKYYNIYSFDIQCFTEAYQKDYYWIFILTIILWTIGMPAIAYIALRQNKSSLETVDTKAKFGFLYHGFHNNRYYWEFVIMSRKILIISIALLMRTSTVPLQLIFVILVLVAAIVANIIYKPFELDELNKTESYSIGLSIICLISGLMIESDATYGLHIVLFCILVISNFLFFCYFAKRVYQAIGHYLWNACPDIARTLCPTAPRPRIKIHEILKKEARKNNKKDPTTEPRSGFVDSNREVVIQLCNMRNYVDFYNEVLAARFSNDNIEEIEKLENEMAREHLIRDHTFDISPVVLESRSFLKRIFTRKDKRETVKDKIRSIRRRTIIEQERRDGHENSPDESN